ncbi:serine hydrolase [Oscillatoriales cyanobacterium USR001]|nr:serine hydrolase [Oscillatoriales cyanobacterium USR001]
MAERFPTRSIFSVVSSSLESDSKLAKSNSGDQSSNSPRRTRLGQREVGKSSRNSVTVPVPDRGKVANLQPRKVSAKSKVENLSAIADSISRKPPKNPIPYRSSHQIDVPQRRKNEIEPAPLPKNRPISGPTSQPKNRPIKRTRRRGTSPLVYATRLLILGVGIAVLAGTVISVLSSFSRISQTTKEIAPEVVESPSPSPSPVILTLQLNQEMVGLKAEIDKLTAQYSSLTPGVFIVDLDTGGYTSVSSDASFAAASTIKVPILVAFFQAVDEGKVHLDQMLTLRSEHIASGSGDLQDQAPGKKLTALEVATKMIEISDNTATNMLIDLLGGSEALNQTFQTWGLKVTAIRNSLPDLAGTNTTSPRELVNLMAQVNQGSLISQKSRDRLFHIMRQTQNDSLLPRGLGEGAMIAHKTGNINSLSADVGMVDMPNGKRYLVAVMVKYGKNQKTAEKLIRDISRTTYQYLERGDDTVTSQ